MQYEVALTYRRDCPTCGYKNARGEVIEGPFGPHWGKLICFQEDCRVQWDWIQKPDSDSSKYRRPANHKDLVKKFGRGFCELCCIKEEDFPPGMHLVGHHVIEYQDGGEPTRENV